MYIHLLVQAVLQVVDKLPTISTQLKIIAAVKATRQGGDGKQLTYRVILSVLLGDLVSRSLCCMYIHNYSVHCMQQKGYCVVIFMIMSFRAN